MQKYYLEFINNKIDVDSNISIINVLRDEHQKWIGFISGTKVSELSNIFTNVRRTLDELSSLAKQVNHEKSFVTNIKSINQVLEKLRIPTFSIVRDRLHTDNSDNVVSYLSGLFGVVDKLYFDNGGLAKYLRFYISGLLDQDSYSSKYLLEDLRRTASDNVEEINYSKGLIQDFNAQHAGLASQLSNSFNLKNQEFNSAISQFDITFRELFQKNENQLKLKLDEVSKKLEEVIPRAEQVASEKIKLISLQNLWDKKYSSHKSNERIWMIALIFIVLISIGSVFGGILLVEKFVQKNNEKIIDLQLVAVGVLIVMFFWIIRLVTKIWLSHSHLKNDAHERSVMTQTYLSLLINGSLNDDQKNMVFHAMFRPIKDGIVQDEGPNSPVLEIVDKIRPFGKK